MTLLERIKLRLDITGTAQDTLLTDILLSAKSVILGRRFPFGYSDTQEVPAQYTDLQLQIAIEMYSKRGAEGQKSHNDNVYSRTWESAGVSESLLSQIVPVAKVG